MDFNSNSVTPRVETLSAVLQSRYVPAGRQQVRAQGCEGLAFNLKLLVYSSSRVCQDVVSLMNLLRGSFRRPAQEMRLATAAG